MAIDADLIRHSVTAADAGDYRSGGFSFVLPFFFPANVGGLPSALPPFWSVQRDSILRITPTQESFWGSAVTIAATKVSTAGFDLDGPERQTRKYQNMILEWSGDGFVPSQQRAVADYLNTGNGVIFEIVRASSAAGSKIIGLITLDSLRCQRTGDPDIPILYRDLKGGLHEMRDYQVISIVDMPDSGAAWFGVGHCAAERAYTHIYRLAAIEQYIAEKVTGSGATKIALVQGMSTSQIDNLTTTAESQKSTKGLTYYMGAILAGILGDTPIDIKEIALRGLPDGFDRKQELDIALLAYADAIGLDPQDLQPLSGQGLGTGTQTRVLHEKAKGRWPARYNKQLAHMLNMWVTPDSVTFSFSERDLDDEKKKADNAAIRAGTLEKYINAGMLKPIEALNVAVDEDDIPKKFLPEDVTPDESLSDVEKPETEEEAQLAPTPETPLMALKSLDAGHALYQQMRQELGGAYPKNGETLKIAPEPSPAPPVNISVTMPPITLSPQMEINLPEQKAVESSMSFEPQHITVNIPPQPALDVTPIADALREQKPPVIHNEIQVAAPDTTPIADALRAQKPSVVTVEGANITVEVPPPKPVTRRVVRDQQGFITEVIEDPET